MSIMRSRYSAPRGGYFATSSILMCGLSLERKDGFGEHWQRHAAITPVITHHNLGRLLCRLRLTSPVSVVVAVLVAVPVFAHALFLSRHASYQITASRTACS